MYEYEIKQKADGYEASVRRPDGTGNEVFSFSFSPPESLVTVTMDRFFNNEQLALIEQQKADLIEKEKQILFDIYGS